MSEIAYPQAPTDSDINEQEIMEVVRQIQSASAQNLSRAEIRQQLEDAGFAPEFGEKLVTLALDETSATRTTKSTGRYRVDLDDDSDDGMPSWLLWVGGLALVTFILIAVDGPLFFY